MWMYNLGPESDVAISTRVRVARNIKDIKFPHIMTDEEAIYVKEKVQNAVKDKSELSYFEIKDLDDLTVMSLIEKHLISKELVENDDLSAVIMSEDLSTCIMINEEDHLRIQKMLPGYDIDSCYSAAAQIDEDLEEKLNIAYSNNYGYLTACSTNVGCAMRVSVMLHLPGLVETGYITPLINEANNLGLSIRGIYGENTESIGDIFQISNQNVLGTSEEDVISKMKIVIAKIIEKERKSREVIFNKDPNLEDEVYRSFGILKYARSITAAEAHTLLSIVKMGVNLGIIKETTPEVLNKLIIDINPFTLQLIKKEVLDDDERDRFRAKYIREELI
ncbi:MAG: protein arginine kinase [Clostridia bacterium]